MSGGLFDVKPSQIRPFTAPRPASPCTSKWTGHPQHYCSVGGGDAAHSIDGGRSWLCRDHLPAEYRARWFPRA